MLPNLGDAKVDKLLSQFSQRYTNKDYIAEKILPPMRVKEKTGKYAKYGTENFRTYSEQIYRAPGVRAASLDYSVSQGSYNCLERALEKIVPDEFVNNTDDPYDPKRDAVATLMDVIFVNEELALSTYMSNTSNLTSNVTLSGTDQWSDYTSSSPLEDIDTGISAMMTATGQRPTVAWMGFEVFRKLKSHPDIREQVKYTNGGQLSDSAFITFLKDYFQLRDVWIGTAIYNSADEGQTAVLAQVWGKHFWLAAQSERPTLMGATLGYTFMDEENIVDKYRDEPRVGEVQRVRKSYDQNVMDPLLVYFIKDAVA